MAVMFHVYVAGAIDPSPDAQRKLAEIMASRYGLPIADVTARLAKGRFRVKANVDRATADVYLTDLGAVGAKVVIEEAGKPSSPSIPAPSRTATPAGGLAAARTSSPSIPVASRTATPAAGVRSGLAAAFENTTSTSQDLGVLGGDSGSFALSSVDGNERPAASAAAFAPPPSAAPPKKTAPKASAAEATSAAQTTDMFAPPDADDENQRVELATDEIEHQTRKVEEARKRATTPPASVPVVGTPVLQRKVSSSIAPQSTPITALAPRGRLGPLSEARNRFAAGVLVAILLGFVPTHLIASYREHDAFQKIDGKYLTDAASAPDPGTWAALDEPALKDKKSAQHDIALTSLALWALFSAGFAYVWFKRVPWTKLDELT